MSTRLWKQAGKTVHESNAREELLKWADGKPTRYFYERRPLKGRKGLTKRQYFVPIAFGESRYEAAPYEQSVVQMPSVSYEI